MPTNHNRSRQLVVIVLIAVLGAVAAACGSADAGVESAPPATSSTIVLSDPVVSATIEVPKEATAGEMTRVTYSISNPTAEPLVLLGGDCGGYLVVRATSATDSTLQYTFSVVEESGYCNTIKNTHTIEPFGSLEGVASWKAGVLGNDAQAKAGDVVVTFELTRVDGETKETLTDSAPLTVLG